MKLSILDQIPISEGETPQTALQQTLQLAQKAEQLGYHRYWIAEHHDLAGLSCPAPDIMLSYVGAQTDRIRIGAGAVLLPHYKPFNIAERYNLLASLFPGRVDLGIGRAPGGSAEATSALNDRYLEKVRQYPELIDELIQFQTNGFPETNMFSKITPQPVPSVLPDVWLLGTSEKSALMAAEKGLPYSFAHFMTDKNGPQIVRTYKEQFIHHYPESKPKIVLAVSAICAETEKEARELALSQELWQVQQTKADQNHAIPTIEAAKNYAYSEKDREMIEKARKKQIVGNPSQVKQQLEILREMYQVDEMMILTITHSYEARYRSYELIASQL